MKTECVLSCRQTLVMCREYFRCESATSSRLWLKQLRNRRCNCTGSLQWRCHDDRHGEPYLKPWLHVK